MNKLFAVLLSFVALSASALPALAQVQMTPSVARTGVVQAFDLSVSSDRDLSTTMVRLLLPAGVSEVTPNVAPGWATSFEFEGNGTTALVWRGGLLPAHHRDDFRFSARMPAEQQILPWRVYQTYEDGSVVSWDLDPRAELPKDAAGKYDFAAAGPFAWTRLVSDVATASQNMSIWADEQTTFFLALLALIFSLVNFLLHERTLILPPKKRRRKAA